MKTKRFSVLTVRYVGTHGVIGLKGFGMGFEFAVWAGVREETPAAELCQICTNHTGTSILSAGWLSGPAWRVVI